MILGRGPGACTVAMTTGSCWSTVLSPPSGWKATALGGYTATAYFAPVQRHCTSATRARTSAGGRTHREFERAQAAGGLQPRRDVDLAVQDTSVLLPRPVRLPDGGRELVHLAFEMEAGKPLAAACPQRPFPCRDLP